VNAVHVPQLVLISRRVHVAVQQALQHVQECRIILGNLKFVLWFQPKGDCCALSSRRLVLLLFSRKRLRSIVHRSEAIAENCVETNEVIPVAVGVEQRVSLVLVGKQMKVKQIVNEFRDFDGSKVHALLKLVNRSSFPLMKCAGDGET
jgi:hypothetical protein